MRKVTNFPTRAIPPLRQLASDIPGIEGPIQTADGTFLVVEPCVGLIWEIFPGLEKKLYASTGGIPAGLQLHPDGSVWVADMRKGILRIPDTRAVEPVVSHFQSKPIKGCNDLTFDHDGNLYFTAPGNSSATQATGEVFCRLVDGTLLRLDEDFAFSNGIALSSDQRLLVVAETFTKKLHGYHLGRPGEILEKFLFGTLPGDHLGGPDGLDFDPAGRLIATNWGGGFLEIFSPEGSLLERLALPFERPSNLHFIKQERSGIDLIITEHSSNSLWLSPYQNLFAFEVSS